MSTQKNSCVVGPLRLVGRVQEYAWGKVGSRSRIAPFASGSGADAPLAEYWIGAHPKAPSEVELADGSKVALDAALSRFPLELLGEKVIQREGPHLPFLAKVLSVNPHFGLSIQLHPDRERARALHAKDAEHYPDPSHKPEIGIAITPVTLLYGCKSASAIRDVVAELPAFEEAIGEDLTNRLRHLAPEERGDVAVVTAIFSRCLALAPDRAALVAERLDKALPHVSSLGVERDIFFRLQRQYGYSDQGLLALFLMNVVTVDPGCGIFIGPNIPHAYLDGDLFECMACSDNVVRAGLTSKFKDVRTLSEIVDCSPGLEGLITPRPGSDGFLFFDTPTREFSVRVLPLGSSKAAIGGAGGPGIILCLGESVIIKSLSTGREIRLGDGGGAFLPAGSGDYEVQTDRAVVYHVTTP
jgi:mannose-6-phosphate isomerase